MKITKWNKLSQCGYALVLAAGLLIPGISQAAIVSGETTQTTSAGDITVAVTVDGLDTLISILWPEDRWVGISFGLPPAHDEGYMIVASPPALENTAYEANAAFRAAPVVQTSQDLTIESFFTSGLVTEILLSRASNTGDPLDFQFQAIEETIALQWALGAPGDPTSKRHEFSGVFSDPLVLTAIPVPAALPLLASGLFALGLFSRRKKAA